VAEAAHDRMRRVANRADDSRRFDHRAIIELDPAAFDTHQPMTEDESHACARELLRGIPAEARPELGQDVFAAVDQHDVRFGKDGECTPGGAEEIS
jgi:hypothetical protein